MREKTLSDLIVEYCAPTLAGMKCCSLFNYRYQENAAARQEIRSWNQWLNPCGLYLEALKWREESVLVYVYRRKDLDQRLREEGIVELLFDFGYSGTEAGHCLSHLKSRLLEDDFPHEIGVFLDYPLGDVLGFIENRGMNCRLCGMWKVYCDQCEALKLFKKYKKCKEVYWKLYQQGRGILKMTVAA